MAVIDVTEAREQALAKDFAVLAPKTAEAARRRTTDKPEEPGAERQDRGENSDPEYGAQRVGGPWQLPKYFWKVVVYMRGQGDPAVAAFRMDQSDYVAPLFERYTPLSEAEARTYQEPLTKIERWTGLSFPALRQYDRFGGTESRGGRPRLIRKLSDITL